MPYKVCKPVVDISVRELCRTRYQGHPKGCPNYGQRPSCPPASPMINELIRLDRHVWAIWNVFRFGRHVKRMRRKHPDWSKRQLECCLYWQGTARKQLRSIVDEFMVGDDGFKIIWTPEACGVNVTATMRRIGVGLEWPPETVAYQVVLAGEAR